MINNNEVYSQDVFKINEKEEIEAEESQIPKFKIFLEENEKTVDEDC